MEEAFILDQLNADQRQVVAAPPGDHLILAGAGSGKTRVLVHRIAWLVSVAEFSPHSLLAVTFTNKAAAEMRGRIQSLLNMPARNLWVGTFHGIAHRLLRLHWREAELPQNFQILDADDQKRMVKRTIQSMQLDEKKWLPGEAMAFINRQKEKGLRPRHVPHEGDPHVGMQIDIYRAYEAARRRGGVVDFAELLLRSHELWLQIPDLLQHYQQRFRYLLVDEFQDTNTIQYAWLRTLTGRNNIMVVGDDDQSIYGWRGARIEHIHQFGHDFPNSEVIRLQQNYRSTGNILQAANHLIRRNSERLGKELWTQGSDGDPIAYYRAFNEIDEARFVVERIRQLLDEGNCRREIAILYRSNAQSRTLEEELLRARLPYQIHGGHRFFERMEIRNAMAYIRLLANRHADAAFERAVNTPPRGIGEKTVEKLRTAARQNDCSLWQAAEQSLRAGMIGGRGGASLQAFLDLVQKLARETREMRLEDMTERVVQASGLLEFHGKEPGERGLARVENLEELVTAARQFESAPEVDTDKPLDDFLNHASLEAGEGHADAGEDSIQMMTLHSAKGLEFPFVFIVGMEEGLFPHALSVPGRLEEERRLCYVGITRAMKQLTVTHAETRRINGSDNFCMPSRFMHEIPVELLAEVRPRPPRPGSALTSVGSRSGSGLSDARVPGTAMRLGQRVEHRKFGEGVVLNCEGEGKHARVQVRFDRAGSKWLMLSYAGLNPLG